MDWSSKRKAIPLLFVLLIVTLFYSWSIPSETLSTGEEGLVIRNAFPDLSFRNPIDLQVANDSSNRLFVVEKSGLIHVFNNTPSVDETEILLDISHLVSEEGLEMGLLGLAFHPQFESNGYFFVDYTASSPRRTVIARYEVYDAQPNQANVSSALVILEILQPHANHNGGQIAFGPDGFLYIAMGDGGSAGDPQGNGQDRSTLLGSLLRINVDQSDNGLHYSIPNTNPFFGNVAGFAEEIFAYGLRNPWRFGFDIVSEYLLLADVGQGALEEINIIENGGNYGWDIKEGSQCYDSISCDDTGLIDPIWEYGRSLGHSVTGGYVYRGVELSQILGKYIYGDYQSGRIWALDYQNETISNVELFDTSFHISSFGVDENQELYIVSFEGVIYTFETESAVTTTTFQVSTTITQTTNTDSTTTTIGTQPNASESFNPSNLFGTNLIPFVTVGCAILIIVLIVIKKQ
ncbi:MAG: PQQ-dependent sugar dehydrogenase [Candidatus Thorarchaeota archaeon]